MQTKKKVLLLYIYFLEHNSTVLNPSFNLFERVRPTGITPDLSNIKIKAMPMEIYEIIKHYVLFKISIMIFEISSTFVVYQTVNFYFVFANTIFKS